MASDTSPRVVILYGHPLLGEGLARCVRAETGAAVVAVPASDQAAVRAALAHDPRVVVYEQIPASDGLDLAARAPHAVLIDISAAMGPGPVTATGADGVEAILRQVRRSCRGRREPEQARPRSGS